MNPRDSIYRLRLTRLRRPQPQSIACGLAAFIAHNCNFIPRLRLSRPDLPMIFSDQPRPLIRENHP